MKIGELEITNEKATKNTYSMEAEFNTHSPVSEYSDDSGLMVEVTAKVIHLSVFIEFYKEDGETKEWAKKQCEKALKRAYEEIENEGLPCSGY